MRRLPSRSRLSRTRQTPLPTRRSQGTNQVDDLQAKIELLQAQVEALQEALESVKTPAGQGDPGWKGGPEYADKEAGFSFKPRGAARNLTPATSASPTENELQRNGRRPELQQPRLQHAALAASCIGADGTIPGGFRYSAEFNFAQGNGRLRGRLHRL